MMKISELVEFMNWLDEIDYEICTDIREDSGWSNHICSSDDYEELARKFKSETKKSPTDKDVKYESTL